MYGYGNIVLCYHNIMSVCSALAGFVAVRNRSYRPSVMLAIPYAERTDNEIETK